MSGRVHSKFTGVCLKYLQQPTQDVYRYPFNDLLDVHLIKSEARVKTELNQISRSKVLCQYYPSFQTTYELEMAFKSQKSYTCLRLRVYLIMYGQNRYIRLVNNLVILAYLLFSCMHHSYYLELIILKTKTFYF